MIENHRNPHATEQHQSSIFALLRRLRTCGRVLNFGGVGARFSFLDMRIRTIKPEFFSHDQLFDAEKNHKLPLRVAYIGLWCASDREGRFKWEPRRLGVAILPYDGIEFSRVLDALVTRGFLVKYRVGDVVYGQVLSFRRHQVINPRESASVIPEVSKADEVTDAKGTRGARVATGDDLARGEGKGREGKGKEGDNCAEASPDGECSAPDPVVMEFPVNGSDEPWGLTESKLAEYRTTFPSLDLDSELRKALQWVRDNPAKRKTARGMTKYLFGWLERSQNRGAGKSGGHFPPPVGTPVEPMRIPDNLKKSFVRPGPGETDFFATGGEQ